MDALPRDPATGGGAWRLQSRCGIAGPSHPLRTASIRFSGPPLPDGEPVAPGTWLKVCARPETVAAVLPTGWTVNDPEYMMTASLRIAELSIPSGYRLQVTTQGFITDAEVLDTDEQVAARGRIARTGSFAVIDQVETSPSHRRRGLGRLVMGALGHRAATQGARTGVLVATRDGRGLYRSLGWTLHAPVTAVVFRPEEIAPPAR